MRISPSSAMRKPTPGSGRPTVPTRSAPAWVTAGAARPRPAADEDLAVVGDAEAHAGQRTADGADAQRPVVVDRGGRRRLGQAVALEDRDADAAEEVPEALAQGRTAGDGAPAAAAAGGAQLAPHQPPAHRVPPPPPPPP